MVWIQFAVVLLFIFIGARVGSIGIGFAGGAGIIVLGLLGLPVDPEGGIPWDVLGIIMAVIACVATMQACGGLDYLVQVTERLLRKNPKRITFYAPIVTYLMTLLCGTGHVAFSSLPVISEVAKEQGIRPSRPLTISVVASQVAIAASPISAATIAMASAVEPAGVDYIKVLVVCIPTTFIGCMVGALVASRMGKPLEEDPVYQERKRLGLIQKRDIESVEITKSAKTSVWIFLVAVLIVMVYATLSSDSITIMENPPYPRNAAIMIVMLTAALIMVFTCKPNVPEISSQATFKGGMSAATCILGVAWLGNTFVNGHLDDIKSVGESVLGSAPWLLAVVLFFASALLYSQGATTATLMPVAQAMGVSGSVMVASFPAVTGLYLLPTYPTTVAAIEMDDTGSTRIGKYVFNHPFLLPGVVSVVVAVGLGFVLAPIIV
ncbi:anaerobic C4-dicarboxylate transporter [Ancrocorticia populi]|uniref:C4-dicarboxylate transporter DcuA n=1 Tax=Ancrocorticia populi TaxID=2175228 RepID=A0A2V1KCV4_9ACTO|nr:anaerobic C4-dicarboxylate transporter [Ancrocorticia populi]PWF27511.1 C4-dicarboxylate ABC transporter [Ancrocorticia populi]